MRDDDDSCNTHWETRVAVYQPPSNTLDIFSFTPCSASHAETAATVLYELPPLRPSHHHHHPFTRMCGRSPIVKERTRENLSQKTTEPHSLFKTRNLSRLPLIAVIGTDFGVPKLASSSFVSFGIQGSLDIGHRCKAINSHFFPRCNVPKVLGCSAHPIKLNKDVEGN